MRLLTGKERHENIIIFFNDIKTSAMTFLSFHHWTSRFILKKREMLFRNKLTDCGILIH